MADDIELEILRAGGSAGRRLGLRTDLIDRFNVSPGVINEALRLLRDRELITVRPGPSGGVFTADQPPGVRLGAVDLWFQGLTIAPLKIFESRVLLEEMFNGLALTNASSADHDRMESSLQRMYDSTVVAREFFEANVLFHSAIASATGATILVGIYDSLVTVLVSAMVRAEWTDGHKETVEHNLGVHREIFEAIKAQDRKRLEIATRLHRVDMVNLNQPEMSPVSRIEVTPSTGDIDQIY